MSLIKNAMAIPYYRWYEIKAIIDGTDDEFMRRALSQLMGVKRNRYLEERSHEHIVESPRIEEHLHGNGAAWCYAGDDNYRTFF